MSRKESTISSFKFAARGIGDALKTEPNLRIHFAILLATFIAAYFLNFSIIEWIILTITVSIVLTLELINTCVEKIVDMISLEVSEQARIIKDISAGMVLISAICAAVVGLLLFLPKILPLLSF